MHFVHGPGLGDVIYSFPLIKHLGGGDLCLLPHHDYYQRFVTSLSFFDRQEYIDRSYIAYKLPPKEETFYIGDFFLNPNMPTDDLVKSHFVMVGMEPPASYPPWLVAKKIDASFPVLVHHTCRYNNPGVDYSFLNRVAKGDLYCIGYPEEADMLVQSFGAKWIRTATMDDLAAVIDACGVYVGNQSSPLAIAVGLGKNRLVQRAPFLNNCNFGHSNEHTLTGNARENWSLLRKYYDPAARR